MRSLNWDLAYTIENYKYIENGVSGRCILTPEYLVGVEDLS